MLKTVLQTLVANKVANNVQSQCFNYKTSHNELYFSGGHFRMPKVHIWLYPFKITDAELIELAKTIAPLYQGKNDKRALILDTRINSKPEWKANIKGRTSVADCSVTIYVMGHTNIDFKTLHSDKNETIGPLDISIHIFKILQNIGKQIPLKIKFINCRSAHARYPRPVCESVFRMTQRKFSGYAYACDISTLTKAEDGSKYINYKQASIQTGPNTVMATRAKDARFEVWPNLAVAQDDGSTLAEWRHALEKSQ